MQSSQSSNSTKLYCFKQEIFIEKEDIMFMVFTNSANCSLFCLF